MQPQDSWLGRRVPVGNGQDGVAFGVAPCNPHKRIFHSNPHSAPDAHILRGREAPALQPAP